LCAAAVALPFAWPPTRRYWPIAAGLLLELVYAVAIGGDFMSGRLLAAPFLVSILLLSAAAPSLGRSWPAALAVVAGLGLCARYPAVLTDAAYGLNRPDIMDAAGISDERAYYYQTSGLLTVARDKVIPNSHYIKAGMVMRFQLTDQPTRVIVDQHAGFYGFSAGPKLHLVDPYALAEPLLARLPAEQPWRIGHFKRTVPEGYVETLQSDQNQIRDISLHMYYDKLSLIVRAPLFAPHRLSTILKMNTRRYDGLIKTYLASKPQS
jgi:arabinofuranosyltransferase